MTEIVRFRRPSEALFDQFVLDELTEPLGFKLGSLALYRAGFHTVRRVHFAGTAELKAVPGIGKRKIEYIGKYFNARGYPFPPVMQESGNVLQLKLK